MPNQETAVLVSIRGTIQGVNYRAWTVRQAVAIGLRGWVRNEPDGSVRALIGGSGADVATMLDLFWIGPSSARVTGVISEAAEAADLPPDFRQIR